MAPEEWKVKSLGSVLQRVAKAVVPEPKRLYREIGIRSHGKGIFYKDAVSGESLGDKRVFEVVPDCLVLNIVFAWEQAVARTTQAEVGMIASHRFPMYQPANGSCDVDYLTYYFKSKRGKSLLELASPGGAGRNKTLGQKDFEGLAFLMPDASEQAKVANVLKTWDVAIDLARRLIANNKAQEKALARQVLTGKKRLPRFKEKWRQRSFKELFRLANDKSKQVLKSDYLQSGPIPVVDQGKGLIAAYCENCEPYSDLPVIVFGDHTREVKWIDFPFAPSADGTQILKAHEGVEDEFAFHLLASVRLPNLGYSRHMRELKRASFMVPEDKNEQAAIAAVLTNAIGVRGSLNSLLDQIREEKTALMQQLLTGKRRVKLDPAA